MSVSHLLPKLLLLSTFFVVIFRCEVTAGSPARNDLQKGSCYSLCDSRYSIAKTDIWSACHHGCRLVILLTQMADRKSRKQVKRSCLSACTEAYNVTSQEKACNMGCGESFRTTRRKASEPRVVSTSEGRTTAPAPTLTPSAESPPSIRYWWAKSVIDEQDVESLASSEERTRIPNLLKSLQNNPLRALSSMWSSSFLPQAIKITKSSVTFMTDDSEPGLVLEPESATATKDKEQTEELIQSQVVDVTTTTEIGSKDETTNETIDDTLRDVLSNLSKRDSLQVLWSHSDAKIGKLDAPLLVVMLVLLLILLILFRALMVDRSYMALNTSDPMSRKEEAAAGSEDEDEDPLFSMRSRLVLNGLLPPTYEEAQNDRPAAGRNVRPLLVTLDAPEVKHVSC